MQADWWQKDAVVGGGGQKRMDGEGEKQSLDGSEEISCLLRDRSLPETV